jgi:hypothetical protein
MSVCEADVDVSGTLDPLSGERSARELNADEGKRRWETSGARGYAADCSGSAKFTPFNPFAI